MPKLDFKNLKRLHKLGFAIHWLRSDSKIPVEPGWTKGERLSFSQLKEKYKTGYNVGVRLGLASHLGDSFLGVLDLDIKSTDPKHKEEALKKIFELFPEIQKSPKVESGRGNGSAHFYVRTKEPISGQERKAQSTDFVKVLMPSVQPSKKEIEKLTKEEIKKGLRIRAAWEISLMSEGRQVVLPGSVHPDTKQIYTWAWVVSEDGSNIPLINCPAPPMLASNDGAESTIPTRYDDVDLDSLGLREDQIAALVDGDGVEDRSAAAFGLCMAMLQRGTTENQILSVLTDKRYFLGHIGYDHANTSSRTRAAIWIKKYCLEKAKRQVNQSLFGNEIFNETKNDWNIQICGDVLLDLGKKDLIEGLLANNSLASIVGQPGAAKSFIGVEILMSIARNALFFGRAVDPGAVFDATLEGASGKARRLIAYLKFHGLDGKNLPYYFATGNLDLRKSTSVTKLIDELKKIKNLKIVMTDTLTAAMGDADQNSSADMNAAVLGMDRIRKETGATVLNIHHLTKSGDSSRGHGCHHAALDSEFTVKKLKSGIRVFEASKQRDFEFAPSIAFELQSIELGANAAGKPVTSAVVIPASDFAIEDVTEPKLPRGPAQALEVLRDLATPKKPVTVEKWRAELLARHYQDRSRSTKSEAFTSAKKTLLDRGLIDVKGAQVWPI